VVVALNTFRKTRARNKRESPGELSTKDSNVVEYHWGLLLEKGQKKRDPAKASSEVVKQGLSWGKREVTGVWSSKLKSGGGRHEQNRVTCGKPG